MNARQDTSPADAGKATRYAALRISPFNPFGMSDLRSKGLGAGEKRNGASRGWSRAMAAGNRRVAVMKCATQAGR